MKSEFSCQSQTFQKRTQPQKKKTLLPYFDRNFVAPCPEDEDKIPAHKNCEIISDGD